jgi:phage FluMu gp28-like protein
MLNGWMRPYQRAWHRDFSRWRTYNKSRRIGVTTGCLALGSVLTSSGIYGDFVHCDNYNLVSKVEVDAKDIVKHAVGWVEFLERDPVLRPYLETSKCSATEIEFKRYRKTIRSFTQSPKAARGGNGHFGGDEVGFWPHADDIWGGGVQSIQGNPLWRADFISTPNGTSGDGRLHYELSRDPQFDYFSRHETDLFAAIEQGFPARS